MQITYVGGATAETPRPLPADRIGFERHFGHRLGAQDVTEEHILWMAWTQLHRVGHAPDDFDEWLPTVEDWDATDAEDEAADPTAAPQEPSTGP
jgi:hypothetical protein